MEWQNLPSRLDSDARLFCRVRVDAKDGTVHFVNGSRELRLHFAQVVRTGPEYCLARLATRPADERPARLNHPEKATPPRIGDVVLADPGAHGRWWAVNNRVAGVLGNFAKTARFAGVDVFDGRRSDIVWDATVAFLAGTLRSATLRLFDAWKSVMHQVCIEFDRPSQDRTPHVGSDVAGGDVLIDGIENVSFYGRLLRLRWSTVQDARRRDGVVIRTKLGEQFFANSELHAGKVRQVNGQWITITDDQTRGDVYLCVHYAPAPAFIGQRLKYFIEHRRDGRVQAIAPRVA